MKDTWFCTDEVRYNALIGFDYCFCNSDCKNDECARNKGSKSFAAMLKACYKGIHAECDFSKECEHYIKEVGK